MFIPLHDANALNHVRVHYVTLSLIVINVLIWLIWGNPVLTSDEAVRATFISFGYIPAVINGYEVLPPVYAVLPEQASFVTYAFFHSGFMHLAGNMLFLWVFGDNVEDAMGHFRFLLFYLACAAAGAFMHGFINPQSVSPLIGASGAAAGVISAYLFLHPRVKIWVLMFGKIPLRISAFWVIGAWISYQVFELVFNSQSDVSWGAHVGGIIAGAVLILFMKRPGVKLFDQAIANDIQPSEDAVEPGARGGAESVELEDIEATPSKKPTPWGRDGSTD